MKKILLCICLVFASIAIVSAQTKYTAEWEELYTPGAPPHRQGHVLVTGGQLIYLFGGNDGARVINDFWSFDPDGWIWQEIPLPDEIEFLNMADAMGHNGRLYIIGQYAGSISPSGSTFSDYLDALLVYDTKSGEWEQSMADGAPPDRVGAAFTSIGNGNGLLFGGSIYSNGDWERTSEVWIFEGKTLSWSQLDTENTPPARSATALSADDGGNVVIFGGLDQNDHLLSDTWVLNIKQGAWMPLTADAVPSPRSSALMAAIDSGVFVLYGGKNDDTYFGGLWLLDIKSGMWVQLDAYDSAPDARLTGALPIYGDGSIYIFGGGNDQYLYNDTWRLKIVKN